MLSTNLFSESEARKITGSDGPFTVIEYQRDLSVDVSRAMESYFASEMNVRKRQLLVTLSQSGVILQAGSMQMLLGDIRASADVAGVGDLLKKAVSSKVTGETAIKPKYIGNGVIVLEPTYRYLILEKAENWPGGMVIEDGSFLACEDTVGMKVVGRNSLSSAILGGEGLFNTLLWGSGGIALESPVPMDEMMIVDLDNDVLKLDGSMAFAWSNSLKFTVEKTTSTLIGSAVSKEGFVNVYRGSGRVLVAPVRKEVKGEKKV